MAETVNITCCPLVRHSSSPRLSLFFCSLTLCNNNNNNKQICIAPLGHNFRGAGALKLRPNGAIQICLLLLLLLRCNYLYAAIFHLPASRTSMPVQLILVSCCPLVSHVEYAPRSVPY